MGFHQSLVFQKIFLVSWVITGGDRGAVYELSPASPSSSSILLDPSNGLSFFLPKLSADIHLVFLLNRMSHSCHQVPKNDAKGGSLFWAAQFKQMHLTFAFYTAVKSNCSKLKAIAESLWMEVRRWWWKNCTVRVMWLLPLLWPPKLSSRNWI